MKITRLTTFEVPPRWLFLKIETDDGVAGWGEPVVEGRATTVAACVEELSDYLIGCDPRWVPNPARSSRFGRVLVLSRVTRVRGRAD